MRQGHITLKKLGFLSNPSYGWHSIQVHRRFLDLTSQEVVSRQLLPDGSGYFFELDADLDFDLAAGAEFDVDGAYGDMGQDVRRYVQAVDKTLGQYDIELNLISHLLRGIA